MFTQLFAQSVLFLCLTLAGGFLAGVVCLAIGGYGGLRQVRKEIRSLQEDVEDLDKRHVKEVKRRAGGTPSPTVDMTGLAELKNVLNSRPPMDVR